jgi:hypothetical protein
MGLFGRWANKLERVNVQTSADEIVRELQRLCRPDQSLSLEAIRAYMLTRHGWTNPLWDAVIEAREACDLSIDDQSDHAKNSLFFLLLGFADNNYAKAGIGEKLAQSRIPAFDTSHVAADLSAAFEDLVSRLASR